MSRYRIPHRVLRAPIEGEEVLLNTKTGLYHVLNETGKAILAAFEAEMSVDDIVRREAEETGEPESRIRTDVEAFVAALRERELIEPHDS